MKQEKYLHLTSRSFTMALPSAASSISHVTLMKAIALRTPRTTVESTYATHGGHGVAHVFRFFLSALIKISGFARF